MPFALEDFKTECGNLASLSKIFYIKKYNIFDVPLEEIADKIKKIGLERDDCEIYQHVNRAVDTLNKYEALDFLHEYLDSDYIALDVKVDGNIIGKVEDVRDTGNNKISTLFFDNLLFTYYFIC